MRRVAGILAALLETAAVALETSGVPPIGPWPRWRIGPIEVDGGRFCLVVVAHPDFVRARAEKLLRAARRSPVTHWRAPAHNTRRARYSATIERAFVEDGELANAAAYRMLYT